MEKINQVINQIASLDEEAMGRAKAKIDQLTKPVGSLGDLEEIAITLAGITGSDLPLVNAPAVLVFAGDHGIVKEGVSAYPQHVTRLMVENFLRGGAAINVFARQINASVYVCDIGVNGEIGHPSLINRKIKYGTNNFLANPAMTNEEAIESIIVGMEEAERLIRAGHNILITGEMGIGNTTASSAMLAAFTDTKLEELVGLGTGIDHAGLLRKINTIRKAIDVQKPDINNPIDVLAKVGGLEIGAMAGAMLQAASQRVPVLVDGLISSTAALLAYKLCPLVKDYLFIGHKSIEVGQQVVMQMLEKNPLLDLQLRLGEGTGGALAYPLLDAATRMIREMATFADLGIEATNN